MVRIIDLAVFCMIYSSGLFASFFDGTEEGIFDVLFFLLLGRSLEDDVDVVAGEFAG